MSVPDRRPASFRISILGAGRLGSVLAERWWRLHAQKAPLWSRRFDGCGLDAAANDGKPFSVESMESVMQADTVFAAIPSRGVVELATMHKVVEAFDGTLFLTGIDLPVAAVQQCMPSALIMRIVPALLPAREDIPCLVLDDGEGGIRREASADILRMFGPMHCVESEDAFESVMYLASPFPVVLQRALRDALTDFLATQRIPPKWQPLAERLLWQGLAAMEPSSAPGRLGTGEADVATPGGVTEAGLREVERLSRAMVDTLAVMIRHGRRTRGHRDKDTTTHTA